VREPRTPEGIPCLLPPDITTADQEAAAIGGAAMADSARTVIGITGAGAVACLQGVLTNDVEHAGERGVVYGALLTPKGMIVTDLWSARTANEVLVIVPGGGRTAALEIFTRYFPPRLARADDREGSLAVLELVGAEAVAPLERLGADVPAKGSTASRDIGGVPCEVIRPSQAAPFGALVVCPSERMADVRRALGEAGAVELPAEALALPRILAGWPDLGAEIGEKTLPQEVRFDDLDGVSYTKGCYTGQETVARVHFRGHPNRGLAGLVWRDAPDPDDAAIVVDGKRQGDVTSAAWSHLWKLWIGIGMVRRAVKTGAEVVAAGAAARVVTLPIPKP